MRGLYLDSIPDPLKFLVSIKEKMILAAIGFDQITTATSFVEYLREKHGFSRSCVWYNLKKLKKKGIVDFAEKGEMGKPLHLTKDGVATLRSMLSQNTAAVKMSPKISSIKSLKTY